VQLLKGEIEEDCTTKAATPVKASSNNVFKRINAT
jgi:hypothetical protein